MASGRALGVALGVLLVVLFSLSGWECCFVPTRQCVVRQTFSAAWWDQSPVCVPSSRRLEVNGQGDGYDMRPKFQNRYFQLSCVDTQE